MKGKFRILGHIGLALFVAVALMLAAAPAAADVSESTVTPSPTTVGTTAQYTIAFTTTATLGIGGEVYIEFPSDTTVPATYETADVTIDNGGGADDISSGDISGSGNIVTITLAEGISGGSTVTVVFKTDADIVNPTTAGTTYTLDVWTSAAGDSTHVPSAEYTITAAPDTTNPTVSLTAPNGGEIWATGSVQSITWTASDDIDTKLTIKLEYYNGSSWATITTLANTSLTAYSWTVPSANITNCKVKVTATDDATNSAYDESDAVFTIDDTDPTVAVVLPNGSETWVESSTHNITWTCSDTDLATNPIAIDYSTDSGTTWTSVVSATANDGTFSWTLPAVYSATCLVKVTATDDAGNTGSDESNAVFTIDDTTDPLAVTVVSPNGGESWTKGSTQSITWTGGTDAIDTATSITLEYSDDAGATWETAIATSETNDGAYSWTPLPAVGVNYLVKVTATDDAGNSAFDVSDAVFTIINPVHNATQDIRYADIQTALDAAVAGDTINVAPGTYELADDGTITIATAGVTLQSTGTAAETIIDVSALTSGHWTLGSGINVDASGVTVDGFTVENAECCGIYLEDADDAIVQDNVITNTAICIGIQISPTATGVTVSGNTLDEFGSIKVMSSDNTISDNVAGRDINLESYSSTFEGTIITDNTFPALPTENVNGAINIYGGATGMATVKDTLIEGNDLSNRDKAGIRIGTTRGNQLTVETLTITGNTITNNAEDGIYIHTDVTWSTGNTISNNNIVDNVEEGIDNDTSTVIDAENNWWGDASGPYNEHTNAAGTGEAVSNKVDYRPWLTSAYSAPVAAVTTVSLVSGWNLVSLPLYIPPANRDPATLLAAVTDNVDIVWGDYDPDDNSWNTYVPGATNDLTAMRDGRGYWVDMTAADTLDVSALGTELPVAPAAPPTYDVVVGWNLIGFKSTTPTTASTYLAAIDGQYTIIYGFANGVYSVVQSTDSLEPGYGYWIAVTAVGTIYP